MRPPQVPQRSTPEPREETVRLRRGGLAVRLDVAGLARQRRGSTIAGCACSFTSSPKWSSPSTIRDVEQRLRRRGRIDRSRASRRCSRTSTIVAPSARSSNASATTAAFLSGSSVPSFLLAVAGRHVRERRHAARDRASLRIGRPFAVDASGVLGDEPEHRRREPARRRVGADLPHVDRQDRAAGAARPARRPRPARRGSGRAGRSTRRRRRRPRPPRPSRRRGGSPGRCASGVPPETSSSSIVSTSLEAVALRHRADTLASARSETRNDRRLVSPHATDADDADGPTNGGATWQSQKASQRRTSP